MWVLVPGTVWNWTNLRTCYRHIDFQIIQSPDDQYSQPSLAACFTCTDSTNHELKISEKNVTIRIHTIFFLTII